MRAATRAFAVVQDVLRDRRQAILSHRPSRVSRIPAQFIPDIAPTNVDVAIANRLLTAYAAATRDDPLAKSQRPVDVWSHISQQQKTFFEVLESRDPGHLAAYLCNMSRHDATHGTVQGEIEYRHLRRSRRHRQFVASMAKDKLVSLAEAVGAISCENPGQGPWGTNVGLTVEDLVLRIEEALGVTICPPPIDGGLYKIGSDGVFFGERDCNAIYTAWLMTGVLRHDPSPSVGEIGGGSGRVAYWANRLGLGRYTLVDLPHINVVQGFYLLKSLPTVPIRLHGEAATAQPDAAGAVIRIMPSFACKHLKDCQFDLVLNQDSFPEINPGVVREYLEWMRTTARRFLSINHESRPRSFGDALQNNVSDLIRDAGGYVRLSRQLYWLRRGYVAELYEVS